MTEKIMPPEPTPAMFEAALAALDNPVVSDPKAAVWAALTAYRAMFNAAPTKEGEDGRSEVIAEGSMDMSDFHKVRAKVRSALDEIGVELGRGVEIFGAERPGRYKIETPLNPPPITTKTDAWFARHVISGFKCVLNEYESLIERRRKDAICD